MEDKGYTFNPRDFGAITIQLLIEILAFQQAAFSNYLERTNLTEEQKTELIKDINDALPALKETIGQALYVSFGKTPDL